MTFRFTCHNKLFYCKSWIFFYINYSAHTEPLNHKDLLEAEKIFGSFVENLRKLKDGGKDEPTRTQIIETVLNEVKKDRRY